MSRFVQSPTVTHWLEQSADPRHPQWVEANVRHGIACLGQYLARHAAFEDYLRRSGR